MEKTLLERISDSVKELETWPKERRESALKEANASANYELRVLAANHQQRE